MIRTTLVAALLVAFAAQADEGMWTFNNFPSQKVKAKYGFEPTQQWLDHVRLSSARLAAGCSGSFVSPDGLVMTNHHCARSCIDQLSTAKKNYIETGFYAKTLKDEPKCPAVEVNKLLQITDVTDQVHKATQGLEGAKFEAAQKAEIARIEKDCAQGEKIRCDVVSLYEGGLFQLYKYARYQDVRLVFAPEEAIAFFGGDPDNFEFPRYDLDVSFLRVYENGKPAKMDDYFRWSPSGAQKGELTFVTGNPGSTERLDTIAELAYQRDWVLPERLIYLSELRGLTTEFQKRSAEAKRTSNVLLFGVENSVKAFRGRREALVDPKFFAQKVAEEKAFQDKVAANPKMKRQYGAAWSQIAQAIDQQKTIRKPLTYLEFSAGSYSKLFSHARTLLRSAEELPRPNGERLKEYADARLPVLRQNLFSPAPIYPDVETMQLTFYLTKLREMLGPDDPAVKAALGNSSPEQVARRAVAGTKLRSPAYRKQLFEGGAKAINASKDPMIALVRSIDPFARKVRKEYEDQIESVLKRNHELLARARFEIYGTSTYPDATFSPRLSYGSVEGYTEDGKQVEPITHMAGTFERATGQPPFELPKSWLKAKSKLDLNTPMDFCTSNDIIGGNSGSPVVNKDAQIVGLIFDGNIQSLGGDYGFNPSDNRAVAVHSAALIEALDKIYGAKRLMNELRPQK